MSSSGRVSFRMVKPLSGIGSDLTASSRRADAHFTPILATRHAIPRSAGPTVSFVAAPFLVWPRLYRRLRGLRRQSSTSGASHVEESS